METTTRMMNGVRGLVAATWLVYALTFIPFRAEYLIQWLFAVVAALGVLVAILSLGRIRGWRAASMVMSILLLVLYVDYWAWITDMARASRPELASPIALTHIIEQGLAIFQNRLASGAFFGAMKAVYFELLMPLLQLVLLVALLIVRPPSARPISASAA